MKKTHRLGLVLWRGGLLLAFGYAAFDRVRALLSFADPELEFAVAILWTGILFVLLSVIVERFHDAKAEREASE